MVYFPSLLEQEMTFLETYINSSLIIRLSARPEINRSGEGKWWGGGGGGGGGGVEVR